MNDKLKQKKKTKKQKQKPKLVNRINGTTKLWNKQWIFISRFFSC